MSPASRVRLAHILIFVAPALWGVNYLVARSAPGVIEANALAFGRWLIAGLLLALITLPELAKHRALIVSEWRRTLLLGALGMYICGAWVYIGGHTTSATNIALIYAISPVLIALFSALVLRESVSRVQMFGIALALAGVLHVILKGQWAALSEVKLVPGDLWILAATLSWTAYSLLLKRWPSPLSPAARLSVICLGGVTVLLPFTLWELWHSPVSPFNSQGGALVLAAALFPGFGAYLAYSFMQRELGAARVGVVLYLGPLYAALMAWVALAEPIRGYHGLGAALILPGVYLVSRPRQT
jgi:drug/metabolite transporter (DMT)-like permease